MKKLVIVSGVGGSLGKAYIDHFRRLPGYRCIAFVRRQYDAPKGIETYVTDLLDAEKVRVFIEAIELSGVSEVFFIHPVGKFKFEREGVVENDLDDDGIDDLVYASNVDTFRTIALPLQERLLSTQIPLRLCAFGSISDPYNIPYWRSYSGSKEAQRSLIRSLIQRGGGTTRVLWVNVSSIKTSAEKMLRPNADMSYWLTCDEIVERSVTRILDLTGTWEELDIYKAAPTFGDSYYSDPERIRAKWEKEMDLP